MINVIGFCTPLCLYEKYLLQWFQGQEITDLWKGRIGQDTLIMV